jgi:hypothetical protein
MFWITDGQRHYPFKELSEAMGFREFWKIESPIEIIIHKR